MRADGATVLRDGTPDEVGMDPRRVQRARDLMHEHVATGQTPSIAAIVARRGVVVLAEALGERGPGREPLAIDSIWGITSVTKPLVATLIMQLAEDGVLGVNRSVVDYLPELAVGDNQPVLIHHLLTHTSGFDDDSVMAHVAKAVENGNLTAPPEGVHPWVHMLVSTTWDAPRTGELGREMIYCNHNYSLLGEIATRVTGLPLDHLLRERIARPLGMTSTGFVLDDDEYARLVERPPEFWGGSPETGAFVLGGPEFAAFDGGMGGGKSTAPDLAIFAQTILNGGAYGDARILSRAAVAAMTRNHLPGIPANLGTITKAESGYGYGWISDTYERWAYFHGTLQPIGVIGHTGAGGNNVFVDRDNEIIIVVLELVRTLNDDLEPLTGLFDRFQNVIYSAVDN